VESYAVGCMGECSIAVVIQTDSYWAQTAPHMTLMTSLTLILLVYFVSNLAVAFSLDSNLQAVIDHIGWLTV
jgi:hypothetical protein